MGKEKKKRKENRKGRVEKGREETQAYFSSIYTKTGVIQRSAWSLHTDNIQIQRSVPLKKKKKKNLRLLKDTPGPVDKVTYVKINIWEFHLFQSKTMKSP